MKIAFDALSAQQGGGVSVFINLLPRFERIDKENSYFLFYSPKQQDIAQAIPNNFHKVAVKYIPDNSYLRVLWEQIVFPFYLLRHRIDVLYSVGNITTVFAPCKIALLIENANPYSRINISWSVRERFRNKLLRTLGWLSAWRAAKIRFVSKNSKNLIVPQLGVSSDKCLVIPHGIVQKIPLPVREGRGEGETYLLTIGVNGPHRNTLRLIKSFSILVSKYGYGGDLVVVGNTGSRTWRETLDKLIQELGIESRVVLTGEVTHNDVGSYFQHADAFVFPSLEETFGIPLLEAMNFSVPIAAADCDLDSAHRGKCFNPFREICSQAAQYFNPFDAENIAQCVNGVLTDVALRGHLVARGKERVQKYNLENTARALVQLFDTIVSPL